MRFNNDDQSIDNLSISCSTEDLSRTLATFEVIKTRKLSDGIQLDQNIAVLRLAIKRQVESKIYMFHSRDILGEDLGDIFHDSEGYAVYKRTGDTLVDLCGCDGSNVSNDTIQSFITRSKITEVFTGTINGEFLGVEERYDIELRDGWDFVEKQVLTSDQIERLVSLGVNVRVLSVLV